MPGNLHLHLGYSFDGGTPHFDRDFDVLIQPTGTEENGANLAAPAGVLDEAFTPTGDVELTIELFSCLVTPDYPVLSLEVCQGAVVIRGFEVAPETTTLQPGQQEDFDALLYGEPHPSVTWTATGGTIDAAGIFTAGDVAGTFTVSATSNLSGKTETASVTIGEAGPSAFTVTDLFASAIVIGSQCNGPQLRDPHTAGVEALPSFMLSAAVAGGNRTIDLSWEEDAATGVVTIRAGSDGSAGGAGCAEGDPLPFANAQANATLRLDFELDAGAPSYTFDATGSVSGGGSYDVRVRLVPIPFTQYAVSCTILDGASGDPMSCPGGSALNETGPLPAGLWRLEVRSNSDAFLAQPSSASGFDLTLTLTPE